MILSINPEISLEFPAGPEAASLAPDFCMALPPKAFRRLLWDCPPEDKARLLAIVLRDCALCGHALINGDHAALAWIVSPGAGSRTGIIHFSIARADKAQALALGRAMLGQAAHCGFESLFCLLPAPFRDALRFAQDLGFQHCGSLAGACWLECRDRHCHGHILIKNMAPIRARQGHEPANLCPAAEKAFQAILQKSARSLEEIHA